MRDEFVAGVHAALLRHAMVPDEARVVVGVSGGADSMALLESLCAIAGDGARSRVIVAHLNHRLRDSAADDAAFVQAQAAARGLACVTGEEDVGALARSARISIEDAARRLRYAFLHRTAVEHGARCVAVAHTADDQAETVLLRLLRGSGLRGLGGMRPTRRAGDPGPHEVWIVRPLLGTTRAQVEAFLARRSIPWRTDESNADVRYRRNRLRHEVMPLIRAAIQPRVVEVLCRLAEVAAEACAYLEESARCQAGVARPGAPFEFDAAQWRSMPPALRGPALCIAFETVAGGRRLTKAHVDAVRSLAEAGRAGAVDLPGGARAVVAAGGVRIEPCGRPARAADAPWLRELPVPGTCTLACGRTLSASVLERPAGAMPPALSAGGGPGEEWIDFDAAGRPAALVVRSRLPGDRFVPLGSAGGRTVKRFLIDRKVPRQERARTPVVAVRGGPIVWIAPHRIDERVRVNAQTRHVLVLKLA